VRQLLHEQGRAPDDFRALFNLLPDQPGATLDQAVDALPRLRDAGATDIAVTSGRHGLRTLDEHIGFITELKARADAALALVPAASFAPREELEHELVELLLLLPLRPVAGVLDELELPGGDAIGHVQSRLRRT